MGTCAGTTCQPSPEPGIITALHKLPSLQRQNNLSDCVVRFEAVLKFLIFSAHELMEVDLLQVTSNTPSLSKQNFNPAGEKNQLFVRSDRRCPALGTEPSPSHPLAPQGNDSLCRSSSYYKDFKTCWSTAASSPAGQHWLTEFQPANHVSGNVIMFSCATGSWHISKIIHLKLFHTTKYAEYAEIPAVFMEVEIAYTQSNYFL